jgi:hypothetical protein
MRGPSPDDGSVSIPSPAAVLAPRPARIVRPQLALQYMGFKNDGPCREYRLMVREGENVREYTVSIPQTAFSDGRARLQDGPDICYLRMQREMLANGLTGPTHLTITDEDLQAYRTAHAPVPRGRSKSPVVVEGDHEHPEAR